jgi:TonB family protein
MTPMTLPVRNLPTAGPLIVLAALLAHPMLRAQTAAATAASSAANETGVSERAKRDAASPLYWIRLNAQKVDSAPTKAAPKISEVRPAVPAAATGQTRPAPGSAGGAGPATAVAGTGSAARAPAEATGALAAPAAPNAGAALRSPAVAAGMSAATNPAATSAARAAAAAAAEPAEEPLALMKANEPQFPTAVMRRLRKGTVQVRFEVQPNGMVANPTVVHSTHRSLNEAAIEAVSGWQFKPVPNSRNAVVDLGFDLDS